MTTYKCCIEYCKETTNDPNEQKNVQVLFHRFPVNQKILCGKWIHSIQILSHQEIKDDLTNLLICSKHFSSFDYVNNKKLHPQAIPSIFYPTSNDLDCENVEVFYEADDVIEDENVLRILNENEFLPRESIKLEHIDVNDDDANESPQKLWDSIEIIDNNEEDNIIKINVDDDDEEDSSPENHQPPQKSQKKMLQLEKRRELRKRKKFSNKDLKHLFRPLISNDEIAENPKEAKDYIDKLKFALDMERDEAKILTIILKKRNQKINELHLMIDELLKGRLVEFGRCASTMKSTVTTTTKVTSTTTETTETTEIAEQQIDINE